MEKLIIDRFEGDYAVCEREDRSTVNILKNSLPINSREGDCIFSDKPGSYHKDIEAAKIRENQIRDKMSRLFEREGE